MRTCGVLLLVGLLVFPLAAQSEDAEHLHSLHAIVFESYPTTPPSEEKGFDAADLPSNDFPAKFSRLFVPYSKPQTIQAPPGFVIPREPMFLDIYTFAITEEQIHKKKRFSRRNDIQEVYYGIKVSSWSNGRYCAELDGRYGDLKFKQISIDAAADKTKIIRVRYSANRTLYILLTPIAQNRPSLKGVTPPTFFTKPSPIYPSALLKRRSRGIVRINAILTKEGSLDQERLILLECPHNLFARNSLDVLLNQWTFKPAAKGGVPIDLETVIEMSFWPNW